MKTPKAPEILQMPVAQFDASQLPADARQPGSDAFERAVLTHLALNYAARGWNAAVTVDDEHIRVVAVPQRGVEPKDYVVGLLQHGFLDDALPMLEALDGMLDDADIAYNHGICLSELGRIEESIAPLRRCLALDPGYTNAAIGLGVAFARLHRADEAEAALRGALAQAPGNVFALRNLAAVLGGRGKLPEALPMFRQAVAAAPGEPEVRYALAQCLEMLGGEHRTEAKALYKQIIDEHPQHPVADAAIAGANRMAGDDLHGAVAGKPRMDAVMYMQGAMDTFGGLPRDKVGQIVMEIARLGQGGLAINDPDRRYTLKSLPGDYSGLHLMCLMHVGVLMFDPSADPSTGLQREYDLALDMRGDSK